MGTSRSLVEDYCERIRIFNRIDRCDQKKLTCVRSDQRCEITRYKKWSVLITGCLDVYNLNELLSGAVGRNGSNVLYLFRH